MLNRQLYKSKLAKYTYMFALAFASCHTASIITTRKIVVLLFYSTKEKEIQITIGSIEQQINKKRRQGK